MREQRFLKIKNELLWSAISMRRYLSLVDELIASNHSFELVQSILSKRIGKPYRVSFKGGDRWKKAKYLKAIKKAYDMNHYSIDTLLLGGIKMEDIIESGIINRPRTIEECPDYRPCPWVGCRWNMYLDTDRRGRIMYNETKYKDMCFLDIMKKKKVYTLQEIADMYGVTRQAIDNSAKKALETLTKNVRLQEEREDAM